MRRPNRTVDHADCHRRAYALAAKVAELDKFRQFIVARGHIKEYAEWAGCDPEHLKVLDDVS